LRTLIKEAIRHLVEGKNLTFEEARGSMGEFMSGTATDAQKGAFLTALRMKGETIDEISALASTMRDFCTKIRPKVKGRLVDTCGTGGDMMSTFNVSTAAAFVTSGAGVSIAKHGNRSVTSKCGSADVLQQLGFNLNIDPNKVESIIENVGVGFMFAPVYHPAMRHVIGVRKELGIKKTVFNILGPLTNPAGANAQVLGVYDAELTEPLAHSLNLLGCEEAMVVHGMGGLDEISTFGATRVSWLKEKGVKTLKIVPRDLGVKKTKPENIKGSNPKESAEIFFRILRGINKIDEPRTEIVLVNGAAGIVVSGIAEDFQAGMELAKESIESGTAYERLRDLVMVSGGDISKLEELETRYG
jgi:anthranilate phosphoribosyltransferase